MFSKGVLLSVLAGLALAEALPQDAAVTTTDVSSHSLPNPA